MTLIRKGQWRRLTGSAFSGTPSDGGGGGGADSFCHRLRGVEDPEAPASESHGSVRSVTTEPGLLSLGLE